MENTTTAKLTDKQQAWLKHLQAAETQGVSLSQYARDNDVKLGALYNWKWILKNEGKLGTLTKKPFIKVTRSKKIEPTEIRLAPSLQIRFPNQALIDIQIISAELPQFLAMIKSL